MKFLAICSILLIALQSFAQKPDPVIATATGKTYTAASLSPEARKIYENQDKILEKRRTRLLNEMIAASLLDLEAKARNTTPGNMLAQEEAKVADPPAEQIQSVYDANRDALGGRPLSEVRGEIIKHLRRDSEEKAIEAFVQALQGKHKIVRGKDVNSPNLKPSDSLASVGTQTITVQQFEQINRIELGDIHGEIYEELRSDLSASILSSLLTVEAASRNMDASSLLAVEVTDKLRLYTENERAEVESALKKRLFAKYNVKILLPEPEWIVHAISSDGDPVLGKSTGTVTVTMFTDFQCPACAATHPALKRVAAEYGDKVKIVVRDFPLESIHPNAFQAALAANAAFRQGKFAEYIEKLYAAQDNLDKDSLFRYAAELGLDAKQFALDFSDEKAAAEVREDIAEGRKLGVGGTPSIFVNGIKVHRSSAESFRDAIDRELKK